jgi:hypothetical protein
LNRPQDLDNKNGNKKEKNNSDEALAVILGVIERHIGHSDIGKIEHSGKLERLQPCCFWGV